MTSINPTAVLQHLHFSDFLIIQQETDGADTSIWKVMIDEGYAALRVLRPDQAEQFKFEIQALNLASSAGIPIPETVGTGTFRTHPCMLSEWIEGSSLLHACKDKQSLQKLGKALGRMHRRLHENTMRQDDTSLLHMDYHPLNVLVDEGKIAGVIDWTNAKWGLPSEDVARTVSILICSPILDRQDPVLKRTLRRIARWYLEGYGEIGDLKPSIRAAAEDLERELDYHIQENNLPEPPKARRMIQRWLKFNS
jgi:Ser/Thr protein kinase RdoA (MazF antagonist)